MAMASGASSPPLTVGLCCTAASQDKSLVGADPVIWHSFGVTHLPRLEDFPVMPVEMVGFMMKPYGFFMWNPTMVGLSAWCMVHGISSAHCIFNLAALSSAMASRTNFVLCITLF